MQQIRVYGFSGLCARTVHMYVYNEAREGSGCSKTVCMDLVDYMLCWRYMVCIMIHGMYNDTWCV